MLFGWIGHRLDWAPAGLGAGSHGAFGAVRPFRAILPTAKRRAPSAHEAADGYAAPKAPCHPAFRAADCLQPDVLDIRISRKIIILAEISNNQQYE